MGPRLDVEAGAGDGGLETLGGHGVGAGDDTQVAGGADGGGDLARHVLGGGEALVGEMAALLGQHLVLELHGRRPGVLQLAHQAHDVERLAVAGVAVDDERQIHRSADRPREEDELVEREHPEIGQGEAGGDGGAGEVERLEAGAASEQGGQRRVSAGEAHDARRGPQRGQAIAGRPRIARGLREPGHETEGTLSGRRPRRRRPDRARWVPRRRPSCGASRGDRAWCPTRGRGAAPPGCPT